MHEHRSVLVHDFKCAWIQSMLENPSFMARNPRRVYAKIRVGNPNLTKCLYQNAYCAYMYDEMMICGIHYVTFGQEYERFVI